MRSYAATAAAALVATTCAAPLTSGTVGDAGVNGGKPALGSPTGNEVAADAGPTTRRVTSATGCQGASTEAPSPPPTTRCGVSGARAFLYHVTTPLGDGGFLELGLYGGEASILVPTTMGAVATVTIRAPLELEGTVRYEDANISLVHVAGARVHPTLVLAPGAPVTGVSIGDRLRARFRFGDMFDVSPLDLPCSGVALAGGDMGEARPPNAHAMAPPASRVELRWSEPLLVKATLDADDGVRLTALAGASDFDLLERRPDRLRIRARTRGGSELLGWVSSKDLASGEGGGGRGYGIALCGCGRGHRSSGTKTMRLAAGAAIRAVPGGPRWARAPRSVQVLVASEAREDWRRIVGIEGLSEGGDACDSGRLEHAWVRAQDLSDADR